MDKCLAESFGKLRINSAEAPKPLPHNPVSAPR